MTDEQLWDLVKRACNLHPNAPIISELLAQFRYVSMCAVQDHFAKQSMDIQISEWNGLSDKNKVILIRHAPNWTTLELIEAVEAELKFKNNG